MNKPQNLQRRKLLAGLMIAPISGLAQAALRTPAASEGPFYPDDDMRFSDIDNDLVRIGGKVEAAGGEIVWLEGRVIDTQGRPIENARVEIWQCDVNQRYLHHGDSDGRARDTGFQGFGFDLSDNNGRYSFRTIKPVPYPGRTPHIHVKVRIKNRDRLTTQFYLPHHPENKDDWLYQQIPAAQRESVAMHFQPSQLGPRARLDLVI